mmetsp:Transcript_55420/g.153466  ORF Transcript_55420/g.153466 Transcript_55420/m.153466 type:complete len:204 (-) Transcript_55420:18-629(-)
MRSPKGQALLAVRPERQGGGEVLAVSSLAAPAGRDVTEERKTPGVALLRSINDEEARFRICRRALSLGASPSAAQAVRGREEALRCGGAGGDHCPPRRDGLYHLLRPFMWWHWFGGGERKPGIQFPWSFRSTLPSLAPFSMTMYVSRPEPSETMEDWLNGRIPAIAKGAGGTSWRCDRWRVEGPSKPPLCAPLRRLRTANGQP